MRVTRKESMTSALEAVENLLRKGLGCPAPFGWGVRKTWPDGGEDPLEKVLAHGGGEEVPHWHYITSGLADPKKVASGGRESGVGYESASG